MVLVQTILFFGYPAKKNTVSREIPSGIVMPDKSRSPLVLIKYNVHSSKKKNSPSPLSHNVLSSDPVTGPFPLSPQSLVMLFFFLHQRRCQYKMQKTTKNTNIFQRVLVLARADSLLMDVSQKLALAAKGGIIATEDNVEDATFSFTVANLLHLAS